MTKKCWFCGRTTKEIAEEFPDVFYKNQKLIEKSITKIPTNYAMVEAHVCHVCESLISKIVEKEWDTIWENISVNKLTKEMKEDNVRMMNGIS